MDSQTIGIGITALVGIAGILSTHLLARAQRKSEASRLASEREDRYRFVEHDARAALCADFLAELKTLIVGARLRTTVTGSYRRRWHAGLAEKAREDADKRPDSGISEELRAFADALDKDPTLGVRMARQREDGLPPALDTMHIVRRLTELAARIGIVSGTDLKEAADHALAAAIAALLRLEAHESRDFEGEFSLQALEESVSRVEEAAIFELRLAPFGAVSEEKAVRLSTATEIPT